MPAALLITLILLAGVAGADDMTCPPGKWHLMDSEGKTTACIRDSPLRVDIPGLYLTNNIYALQARIEALEKVVEKLEKAQSITTATIGHIVSSLGKMLERYQGVSNTVW